MSCSCPRHSDRTLPQCRLVAIRVVSLLVGLTGIAAAAAAPPWIAMDYGPFLTASIDIPGARTNIAYKGIAVNLGSAAGSTNNEAVVFDTDLLRYAAGWTGRFVALKGVVYDGEHWAYPRIDGREVFSNPPMPGWAIGGDFSDPRPEPYGPMPRKRGHWRGLFLHGSDVILAYDVGGMPVLELAGLEREDGITAFTRTLNLGPSSTEMVLQVGEEANRTPEVRRLSDLALAPADSAAGEVVIALPPRPVQRSSGPQPDSNRALLGLWSFDGPNPEVSTEPGPAVKPLSLSGARFASGGRTGGALVFSGEQAAEIHGANDVDPTRNDFTVAMWMRTRKDGTLFARTRRGPKWVPGGLALFLRGGQLTCDVGWVGAVQGRTSITDDVWHHVALAWRHTDGQVRLFVDGKEDGTSKLAVQNAVPEGVVRLGFAAPDFPASPWLDGSIDDLRLYGRTLDESEVATLAGRTVPQETLAVAVTGAVEGMRWAWTPQGDLRLHLAPHGAPVRLKVFLWRGASEFLPVFGELVRSAPPAANLEPRTHGGRPRWPETLVTHVRTTGDGTGPLAVDELEVPEDNPWHSWMRFGGVDFFADGRRAALSTWSGDVWVVSGIGDPGGELTWRRVASGLFQPLGVRIVDDVIYVLGRDQITRLHDLDGDGEADWYENFNNDAMVSEHFHEFANDLKVGPDGDFYYVKCARHALPAVHSQHGTLIRVSRDGTHSEIIARGFRAVNGLGIGPHGELTTIDNQGNWMPANRLNWIRPDGWYGNQWAWNPENRTSYDEPLCWIHNFVDRSGGTHLWVPEGRWGAMQDQLITLSYGMGRMFLVLKEQVGEVMQGAITRFPVEFETGVMRGVFHPSTGDLYACGLFGWAGNKTRPGGFYRIRATGRPWNMVRDLHVTSDGLLLGFTDPLEESAATDPGNYDLKAWNYRWTAQYGSPDLRLNGEEGRDTWRIDSAQLSADRRTVFLKVPQVQPVMQWHLVFRLRSADGTPVENFVHGTIHRTGRRGGLVELGPDSIAHAPRLRSVPAETRPGLVLSLQETEGTAVADLRTSRLAALYVREKSPASPWIGPGPFHARWDGFLVSDINDQVRFVLDARGPARLSVNGTVVVETSDTGTNAWSPPVDVRGGLNAFRLDYGFDGRGPAQCRVGWSSPRFATEPIPPTSFVHDARDPRLAACDRLREGRRLFSERRCQACHAFEGSWEPTAMPELSLDAPAFDGIGSRLRESWITDWLLAPRQWRSDARMPSLLSGPAARQDARDLAAFLGRQRGSGEAAPDPEETGLVKGSPALGARLFTDLGCLGCHGAPGASPAEDGTRIGLSHVAAKWRPEALPGFLQKPGRFHAWSRMPDFHLTRSESVSLARYLLQDSDGKKAGAAPDGQGAGPPARGDGDAVRGERLAESLRCLRCHTLGQRHAGPPAMGLTALMEVDWNRGCLAGDQDDRGRAPDFSFTPAERDALQVFRRHSPLESLQRDCPAEFTERQWTALRCGACHGRDGEPDLLASLVPTTESQGIGEEDAAGTIHRGRPALTFAGEKLWGGWIERCLAGTLPYKPRPDLPGRMPAFPVYARAIAEGLAQQHGYPFEEARRLAPGSDLREIGHRLIGVENGFSCISCHGVGPQAALAGRDTATVNFAVVAERLRWSYYWRYVQDPQRVMPGTMMPRFIDEDGKTALRGVLDGNPRRQFEAVWNYLQSLDPALAPK